MNLTRYYVCEDPAEWLDGVAYEEAQLKEARIAARNAKEALVEVQFVYDSDELVDDYRPIEIELSLADGEPEIGEHGWLKTVTAYCNDKQKAKDDQSIDGSSWETPSDVQVAYAALSISGVVPWSQEAEDAECDALEERLKANGYDPMWSL